VGGLAVSADISQRQYRAVTSVVAHPLVTWRHVGAGEVILYALCFESHRLLRPLLPVASLQRLQPCLLGVQHYFSCGAEASCLAILQAGQRLAVATAVSCSLLFKLNDWVDLQNDMQVRNSVTCSAKLCVPTMPLSVHLLQTACQTALLVNYWRRGDQGLLAFVLFGRTRVDAPGASCT
jgi:hypothetical protein